LRHSLELLLAVAIMSAIFTMLAPVVLKVMP
jgi:hypothetical protein